jgi:hypothetical protein
MALLRHIRKSAGMAILLVLTGLLAALSPVCGAAALPSSGVNVQPPTTALVFYAEPQVNDNLWPLLFQTLLEDLSSSAGELPQGVVLDKQPAILRGSDDLRGISFRRIISVKLLGRCDLPAPAQRSRAEGPLGWVLRVSGKVQPYIYIDCTRLAQVLEPATVRMTRQRRQEAMAQAISRVLIHEWVHVATQSSVHSSRGLAQPNLSVNDLIGDLIGPSGRNRLSASTR